MILCPAILLQAQIPIGSFRAHLPYGGFYAVAAGEDYVYAATGKSLMLVDKSDHSLSSWSKVDGLTETGISKIHYSKEARTLIIAYTNSNIDLIRDGQLTNISDIKNKQITGIKYINQIVTSGNTAYLACTFGVVLLDLENYFIRDTWFTNRGNETYSVNDLTLLGDSIFIATSKGIYSMRRDSPQIANFSVWKHIEEMGTTSYPIIESFGNRLFVLERINDSIRDTLYRRENGLWQKETVLHVDHIRSIESYGDELLVCNWNHAHVYNSDLQVTDFAQWQGENLYQSATQAILDGDETIWISDRDNGLVYFNRPYTFSRIFRDNGPYTEKVEDLDYSGGVMASVPGTRSGWGISYYPPSVSWFSEEKWQYSYAGFYHFYEAHDLNRIVINPKNNKEFFIGSWNGGLLKVVDGNVVEQYTHLNSPLDGKKGQVLVSGLCFDKADNLWITNSESDLPLKVLKNDGTWDAFSLAPYITGSAPVAAEHVLVDSRNFKWVTLPRNGNSLVVFKSRGQVRAVDMNSRADIKSTTVTCIAEDNEGQIWIGTDQGIKVIYNPGNAFNGTVYATNILIEQMGHVQGLLQFEQITDIAVDGGNRKWIGTQKAGVFLMSPDGTEELLHFTAENSPLFSNQINSICINSDNGEVFIGTSEGVISYRGGATKGKENYDEAMVFPNPVREDYRGDIAVSGLMDNSFCKIADAAGRLVWQGYALGGQLIWNGKDFDGKRPATGVYFVFASDETGKEKKVAKILFIN